MRKKLCLILCLLPLFAQGQLVREYPFKTRARFYSRIQIDSLIQATNQIYDGTDVQDSTITAAKLTQALLDLIISGGSITNNPDDVSLKTNGSSQIYVYNVFALQDTMTAGDTTPDITNYQVWLTDNSAAATSITDFDGDPASTVLKVVKVVVRDDSTTFLHDATNFDLGGVNLVPLTGDVMEFIWTGAKWHGRFAYIE